MYDGFNRRIHYLRISVTDRCNLRCEYCMPREGVSKRRHSDILSYEEIAAITGYCAARGFDKVRITGGEPLVRLNVTALVEMLSKIDGIRDLSMTTNGTLLDRFAGPLAQAGLHRVNISLDTVDPERYREITLQGNIRDVFRGIDAARSAGLEPIKLNCVVQNTPEEKDAREVADFAEKNGLAVRFIRRMDRARGRFWPVMGGAGGNCESCNRLRLTSDGRIFPCLFSDITFDIRKLGVQEALDRALAAKPRSGLACTENGFHEIGG
ncbi:MAG: GTP 3',8-cyclase MoaA [Candidatus Latescibacterota bacterium]